MRNEADRVASWSGGAGDRVECGMFLIEDFLRIIETAATLWIATEGGVGGDGAGVTTAGHAPDLFLPNRVAAANDHAMDICYCE